MFLLRSTERVLQIRKFNRQRIALFLGAFATCAATVWAVPIPVPNASFELPATVFVNTHIGSWEKSAQPDWYTNSGGYLWDQLTGVFLNTATNSPDHIDNCDGNQAAWLFAVPQVGLFQDYDSTDDTNQPPTHAFNAIFEAGKSYHLTVGVIGGGGGMLEGVSLELSLYFRDSASNMVTVAAVNFTNSLASFPSTTHLVDCDVRVPLVQPGDPWAGQHIGVQMLSTVDTNSQGGYWDLDNVRLVSNTEPVFLNPICTNGQFQATLLSEPGSALELLASADLDLPRSNWSSLAILTNLTGTIPFTDPTAGMVRRFYVARQLP